MSPSEAPADLSVLRSWRHALRCLATSGVAALLLSTAVTAVPASGAAPLRETTQSVTVMGCSMESGELRADLGAGWSDDRSPDSSLTVSTADGTVIAYERFEEGGFPVQWDGAVLSGHLTLVAPGNGEDDPSEVVGAARFELTLAPDGTATTETTRGRDENSTIRQLVTRQPMVVTSGPVTVALDGRPQLRFDASGCSGARTTRVLFVSQPDTSVERLPWGIDAECLSTNVDGDQLRLELDSHQGAAEAWAVVESPDGTITAGFGPLEWNGPPDDARGAIDMVRVEGEEYVPAGVAVIELQTRKTGQTRTTMVFQGGRDRTSTTIFQADGTVAVDGLAPFAIAACEGLVQTALNRRSSPSGPNAGGPVPANDAPEDASALDIGARALNVQTGGAARDAEAPMSCHDDPSGEGVLLPGHSVWYRIAGTGGAVTVDPMGSSFNTVLAVYTRDGGDLVEQACVDDIVGDPRATTTQAPLTFETVEGGTYYVQAAGFAHQFGRLRLAAAAG